jgi:hypothetical protein
MNRVVQFFCLGLTTIFLFSCYTPRSIFFNNGYPHDVVLYAEFEYQGEVLDRKIPLSMDMIFLSTAHGHEEYSNIISLRIETMQGVFLAEYTPEYISEIRSIFITGKYQSEAWILTEKGLFLETDEIRKRYKYDNQKITEYYSSDKAVQDLTERLDKNK